MVIPKQMEHAVGRQENEFIAQVPPCRIDSLFAQGGREARQAAFSYLAERGLNTNNDVAKCLRQADGRLGRTVVKLTKTKNICGLLDTPVPRIQVLNLFVVRE